MIVIVLIDPSALELRCAAMGGVCEDEFVARAESPPPDWWRYPHLDWWLPPDVTIEQLTTTH